MDELPPSLLMMQMLAGFQVSQALYTVAELDVAGLLLERPRPIGELADAAGADPDALRRIVRFLETVGVFRVQGGVVEVAELGATLAEGAPGSVRGLARYWMETHYASFGDLLHTLRTGEPAATHHLGKPFFDWIAENPRLAELQNAGMATGGAAVQRDAALAGYRLPPGHVVADLGGSDGHNLSQLLAAEPDREGIVFDLPEVVAGAHPVLAAAGLTDRVRVVEGDFFMSVPAADVYVMSTVLHDWNDEKCLRILGNITKIAPAGTRLVLLEMVIPEDASPHPAKAIDLVMLAMLDGRERTAEEWRELLWTGGFSLDRVVESPSPFSIIEATVRPDRGGASDD
jgi:DNA-binding Lrp family transcriptional regulator